MISADELRSALLRGPVLPGSLVRLLARRRWDELGNVGIGPGNYGTAAALALSADAFPVAVATIPIGPSAGGIALVERFAAMPRRYVDLGLVEAALPPSRVEAALTEAARLLSSVPWAAEAAAAVVRSVHVLETDGPAYDVSYSDPDVPFSIFVGLHPNPVPQERLRLAEGVLHEAMHLLLSLVEDVVLLVAGSGELRHSPWQQRPRPAQGILHGLFVFASIRAFMSSPLLIKQLEAGEIDHALKRVQLIEAEMRGTADLVDSDDLTDDGRDLAATLLGPVL